ncbi:DUF2214 family protein [Trichothermofontia sp.]
MWASTITAYLHYLSFMLAFGALIFEVSHLKKDFTLKEAWSIVIADIIYGITALGVLVTGILRVLYFGQGTHYYLDNPVFYTKVAIFLIVGTFSLYPTFSFILWIPALRQGQLPSLEPPKVDRLLGIIRLEVFGFTLIPLFAAMMARGIGLS